MNACSSPPSPSSACPASLPAPLPPSAPGAVPRAATIGHGAPHPLDRAFSVLTSRFTRGISPSSVLGAYADWLVHLAMAPAKQQELLTQAVRDFVRLGVVAACPPWAPAQEDPAAWPQDHRFDAPDWRRWPFAPFAQSFLRAQQWWHDATTGVRGVSRHHAELVSFLTRQWLDVFSPSNWPWANPQVLQATRDQAGLNLWRGAQFWWQDLARLLAGAPLDGAQAFAPGRDIACTPGKVVLRNSLIELLQYAPATPTVQRDPVLIVPSWILKYYILDLSPGNSLVRYLVERGHTVFMVSWRNPGSQDRELGMDDYLRQGVHAALDAVRSVCPSANIHAVGYCLGGTLLAMAAAALAHVGDRRLGSLTLLASELDFSEPGELGLFIDESQLAYLDDLMWQQGYLDGKQMSGTFALLNSRDLLWSRIVRDYLMGERRPMSDLDAWSADATRMPYRQHGEYLERLYLRNDLAEGRYVVDGRAIALADIHVPVFGVGTERDTVSPWRSVFKMHLLLDAPVTFCLTSGGHNVGIVDPPGPGVARHYRLATRARGEPYLDPDAWQRAAPVQQGSWWPSWQAWLAQRSGPPVEPRVPGAQDACPALGDAPGSYVLQR